MVRDKRRTFCAERRPRVLERVRAMDGKCELPWEDREHALVGCQMGGGSAAAGYNNASRDKCPRRALKGEGGRSRC